MTNDKTLMAGALMEDRELMRVIGERIKKIRDALRLNQREFAESIGVVNTYLSKVENGGGNPTPAFYAKIAGIHNVRLDYLILGKGDMFKTSINADAADDRGFIAEIDGIEDLAWFFNNSHIFRTAIIAYANRYVLENDQLIKKNIQQTRERK